MVSIKTSLSRNVKNLAIKIEFMEVPHREYLMYHDVFFPSKHFEYILWRYVSSEQTWTDLEGLCFPALVEEAVYINHFQRRYEGTHKSERTYNICSKSKNHMNNSEERMKWWNQCPRLKVNKRLEIEIIKKDIKRKNIKQVLLTKRNSH